MMAKPTTIIDMTGQYEESIERLAKHLGQSQIRRRIFREIYGRIKKLRSVKGIAASIGISDEKSNIQQVRNELDHLAKYHLIAKYDNDGHTKDGSRYVYGKEPSVSGHKDKIIRYADNPQAAKALPTKRRPLIQGVVSVKQVTKRALKKQKHLNVLYLAANPDPVSPLRLDVEVRRVQEAIRSSKFRDNITVQYRPAADLNSLIDGLNDHRPQIVHFSGHGNEKEIFTDTGTVGKPSVGTLSFDLLAKALNATDSPPEVVILNSCNSSAAKQALLPVTKIIVTMQASITDIAAMAFAQRFYAAIASGQSVKAAFDQGKVAVEAASIGETDTPKLLHLPSLNPASIVLT